MDIRREALDMRADKSLRHDIQRPHSDTDWWPFVGCNKTGCVSPADAQPASIRAARSLRSSNRVRTEPTSRGEPGAE